MADEIKKPLTSPLTGKAALIVGTIGGLVLASAAFIPSPWNMLAGWVGFIACVLAGMVVKPPAAIVGKPVLQGTALTVASGVMGLATQFYPLIPSGWPQGLALGVVGLLAWLTGAALPALGKPSEAIVEGESTARHEVDSKQLALDVLERGTKGPPQS